ncbi:hypothetical protein P170DRAFT_55098 [Aspergillus steynii IBT 23096]|uniref:Uncharacterized protein n=1 Tax=Aspergillus steynii IBT 23096 TaxID=1392250 RepID=A0A2I2FSD8_9EURO|nr:uncharacterized protein P170DRAFT_55098 [Aspergillus steynii IBT 23096]PLB43539.1 hypothetical protein P170DRAFT_55098 [Aspergillus steynii IBT 23096]
MLSPGSSSSSREGDLQQTQETMGRPFLPADSSWPDGRIRRNPVSFYKEYFKIPSCVKCRYILVASWPTQQDALIEIISSGPPSEKGEGRRNIVIGLSSGGTPPTPLTRAANKNAEDGLRLSFQKKRKAGVPPPTLCFSPCSLSLWLRPLGLLTFVARSHCFFSITPLFPNPSPLTELILVASASRFCSGFLSF